MLLLVAAFFAACGDATTAPTAPVTAGVDTTTTPPTTTLPPTTFGRKDLTATGTVVNTADGYTVDGSLMMRTTDTSAVTFKNAQLRVRFGADDHVTSVTGTADIPSIGNRVSFAQPVRADVGLFSGAFLNQERNLGITLKDNTDYFVYDVAVAFQMDIATGRTDANATRPVSVKLPIGGRILMVVDYTDPMYYLYGEQDLIGGAGVGWSQHSRIPFAPQLPVAGLGAFDGKNIRTGTFPIFEVLSVTGQTVDNQYDEEHLFDKDPYNVDVKAGYQAGFNGSMSLELGIKDVVGLEIPIADGSGGVWAEASLQGGFAGHAYATGMTSRDDSWWPAFIPARPVTELDAEAYITSDAAFKVGLAGRFGWAFPDGDQAMSGGFSLTNDSLTLTGGFEDAAVQFAVTGVVTKAATTVFVQPPPQLLDRISSDVTATVMTRIDAAQKAWDKLEKATSDYEIELSLRGLRSSVPTIADQATQALTDGIAAELKSHEGTVYYNSLRSQVNAAAAPYYSALSSLKTQAQQITDNAQTRSAIESALRSVAARKIFTTTYVYKDPIFGATLATVNVSRRIMSDANADRLVQAANDVPHITETSDVKISMQQIYDQVDDKALFEQVRDDITNGVLVMRGISQLGFVFPHGQAAGAYHLYAVIDGVRYEAGTLSAMTVDAFAALLPSVMIQALKAD
ncbi:MAG: hypothetical protein ACREPM_22565 [Gemmatimonadaceae bacterium]